MLPGTSAISEQSRRNSLKLLSFGFITSDDPPFFLSSPILIALILPWCVLKFSIGIMKCTLVGCHPKENHIESSKAISNQRTVAKYCCWHTLEGS